MTDHEKNTRRIMSRLVLAPAELAAPGELTAEIDVQHTRARVYVNRDTPPQEIEALVDAKADSIAEWLDTWGID